MSDTVIRVEKLGKLYSISEKQRYDTLRDTVANSLEGWLGRFKRDSHFDLPTVGQGFSHSVVEDFAANENGRSLQGRNGNFEYIWALRDLSFEIKQGEVVGIIGRNGAGKSTLLKILSRITEPTEGEARIYGRVSSLLEVGTGFHPELTGRENIYLNGAILGMRRTEIDRKFDEIVAFAEVERFINTPVKRFSSGMYMRLAFSVAAHLEPEILIVDEVLAVGDATFQKKCLGIMGNAAREGRTVLFVSHNMEVIQRLCRRCLLLSGGQVAADGDGRAVVSTYLADTHHNLRQRYVSSRTEADCRDVAILLEAEVLNEAGESGKILHFGEPFTIRMRWHRISGIPGAAYAIRVYDERDSLLFAVNTLDASLEVETQGFHEVSCRFQHNVLVPGEYYVAIGCYVRPHTTIHAVEPCFKFVVMNVPGPGSQVFNIVGKPVFAMSPVWTEKNV